MPAAKRAALGARPHLLVVDDEMSLRRAVRRILQSHFEIVDASHVEAARAALRSTLVTAVLSDYELPDGTGADVLGACRDLQPTARRFLMSGSWRPEIDVLLETGLAVAFLRKPFAPVDLRRLVLGPDIVST